MTSLSLRRGLSEFQHISLSRNHQSLQKEEGLSEINFDHLFEGISSPFYEDPNLDNPLGGDEYGLVDENSRTLEARNFDTFTDRLSSLAANDGRLTKGKNFSSNKDTLHITPPTSFFDVAFSPSESLKDNSTKLSLHCLPYNDPRTVNNRIAALSPFDDKETNSTSRIYSPFMESSARLDRSSTISTPKRLTFLKNLESVPTEADIFAIRSCITSIKASIPDQETLLATLSSFAAVFEDISTRANYWGWAPKYFSFIYKILQGHHGAISNQAVLNYCSALLSYLACLMTKFDYYREPSIQRYFVKKALPRLVQVTGKHNTKFDTPSLAMMYICFHLSVDEAVVKFLVDIRLNIPDFFTSNSHKILRYRRAFWFGSVCNRLLIQNDLNYSPINKELLFQCVTEAQHSYIHEKEVIIKSAFNKFFYFNDKRRKYPDNETEYRNFGDSLADIPAMIQKQMDATLKNDDNNKAGGKLINRIKKLIKN